MYIYICMYVYQCQSPCWIPTDNESDPDWASKWKHALLKRQTGEKLNFDGWIYITLGDTRYVLLTDLARFMTVFTNNFSKNNSLNQNLKSIYGNFDKNHPDLFQDSKTKFETNKPTVGRSIKFVNSPNSRLLSVQHYLFQFQTSRQPPSVGWSICSNNSRLMSSVESQPSRRGHMESCSV